MTVDIRIATPDDIGALETLIERSSRALLVPFLSPVLPAPPAAECPSSPPRR